MLEATPHFPLSNRYRFFQEGAQVGTMRKSFWRRRAELVLPGATLHARARGVFRLRFFLERDGQVVATAVQRNVLRNDVDLELGGVTCLMQRRGLLARKFDVLSDEPLGSIVRQGWVGKRALIDLPPEWPLPLQFFTYFIVVVIWNRMEHHAG